MSDTTLIGLTNNTGSACIQFRYQPTSFISERYTGRYTQLSPEVTLRNHMIFKKILEISKYYRNVMVEKMVLFMYLVAPLRIFTGIRLAIFLFSI